MAGDDEKETKGDDMQSFDPENASDAPKEEKAVTTSAQEGHSLKSKSKGESEVEQLAERIELKRANRVPVTLAVRKKLLHSCSEIAKEKAYPSNNKIDLEDLVELREQIQQEVDKKARVGLQGTGVSTPNYRKRFFKFLGFLDTDEVLVSVLDKAMVVVRENQLDDDDWFYFRDFGFYHTQLVSRWPWMRSPLRVACMTIFCFYFFTPIFFCHIIDDEQVCPDGPDDYSGWMTSLYFASVTMSTVGYGDVSVELSSSWRVFMGILYMILSILVAISAFSAAADAASSPLDDVREWILNWIPFYKTAQDQRGLPLHQRIKRLKFVKITEITFQFLILNLLGAFVSRAFAENSTVREERWTWMESFYWAVQTTTTIGYGDLSIPFDMRWFNIFYLMLSTYFVGNAFGKLASLKQELDDTRRYYAWERREVSKGMIEEFQAYEHDDVIDQYEFVLASLFTLNKISASDVGPIMDKYRELAGDKGFIQISEDMAETREQVDEPGQEDPDFNLSATPEA